MSEKRTRKRDLFDRFVLVLNTIGLLALAGSYLAGSVSPEKIWPLAFVAMSYPIILAVIAMFMAYWLIRRRRFFFLNLGFLLLKWDYVSATFKIDTSPETTIQGINVMSYNVRLFDRYNWSEDKNTGYRAQDFIFNQQSDILCIQEYYHRKGDQFRMLDTSLADNRLKNMHHKNYFAQRDSENELGVATFTSYPVVNKSTVVLPNSRSALAIFTDVLIGTDTVRIYNIHLQSIHLGSRGYRVLDEIIDTKEIEDVKESEIVLRRLKRGFIKRAEQAELLADHIQNCRYPKIVCGDFNDVPTSYTYQRISKGLKDSFSEAGNGIGATYVRVPFFRIDNILYSEEFEAKIHVVHPYELSDHLAISATLNLKD